MAESEQQTSKVTAGHPLTSPLSLAKAPLVPSKSTAEEFVRPSKRARLEPPPPMTAAAAFADARQRSKSPVVNAATNSNNTSINPAAQVLGALKGVSQNAVSQAYTTPDSKTQDTTKPLGEGISLATGPVQSRSTETSTSSAEQTLQTSPTSATSLDTQDGIRTITGTGMTMASPQPMEANSHQAMSTIGQEAPSPGDNTSTLVSPVPLLQAQLSDGRRHMSLPHSGMRQNTRSPSSKKHRCPYCATEFTRHHNLKSHLLTHSQEKPYVCSTCQSRFRRLHDLKRHTKLHTGERPHVCPKCNRKFARGDALARHTKGPGGCAGRRASMGSFAGDDDYDGADDTMEDVVYGEPESMEDLEGDVAKGTPSIRRQAPSGDDSLDDPEHYSHTPSTYPPIQGRPPGGIASGHFPPRQNYGPPSSAVSSAATGSGPPQLPYPSSGTSNSSLRPSQPGSIPGSQMFIPNPLTESPKPLSPNQTQNRVPSSNDMRNQSPNLSQFQPPQQPFNRSVSSAGPLNGPGTAPQLPPPHGLNPPDSRFTLPSQGAPTHPPTQPSGPPTHMGSSGPLSSHSNSLSSHGQSGHGSGENASSMFNKDERIWAFVKDLERKVHVMQDEINSLRSQLAAAIAAQPMR